MNIVNLLNRDTVKPNLEAKNKEELLEKLINALASELDESELEEVHDAVMQRESIMSTGVGKGLAIPHGKARGLDRSYAAFALLEDPIDYNAIDEQPVHMVFLLVGPQAENSLHIKLLSRISRLMNNSEFRQKLQDCQDADCILETFNEEEKRYFGVEED